MMQKSWSEIVHDMIYHPFGRKDPAYEAHLFREEMIQLARQQLSMERAQTYAMIEQAHAIERLREQFSDAVSSLGYQLSDLQQTFEHAFEISTQATMNAIARSTALQLQAIAESRDTIRQGFRDLGAAFSFGLSQIAWRQEQTNKLLTDILAVLKAPRKTEADEMRERGDEAYRNGLNARRAEDRQQWMSVALQAYADCVDKNPSDFSALYSIGTILFYERGISDDALTAFRMAAIFSEPYSPYHSALAWLQLSYIRRCRRELEEAYEATQEAVRLQPDWAETHFQHAISCALTNRLQEMSESLKRAIGLDRNYWFRACTEPDLMGVMHEAVGTTLEELRQEALQKATEEIAVAESALTELNRLIEEVAGLSLPTTSGVQYKEQAENTLEEARKLKASHTYFELLDALSKAKQTQQICEWGTSALSKEASNALDNRQRELEAQLHAITQEFKNAQEELESRVQQELENIENALQSRFNSLRHQIWSERDETVKKLRQKWSHWDEKARKAWTVDGAAIPAHLLGFPLGFAGCFAHVIYIENMRYHDVSPLSPLLTWGLVWAGTYVVICGFWWLLCQGLAESAKQAAEQLEQECDRRIAKLEQEQREELEQRQREINMWAERERQALRERFERQYAGLECQMEEEVIRKREALARLLSR